MTRVYCLSLTALLVCSPVFAQTPSASQDEPSYPIVRLGVVSYVQYDAELENRDGYNAFEVTRGYFNINAQVAPKIRFRLTPDVHRVSSGDLTVRVKYAYAQFDDVLGAGSWIRLGQHQTPWLDFQEHINRYRVQGQMFSERDGLIPGSADVGVGVFSPLPEGYGEIQAGVYNGEGYSHTEQNKYKSVQGRLTVRPLPNAGLARGLRVSAFYNAGWYDEGQPRRLGIVMGSFEHEHVAATIERVFATENPVSSGVPDTERRGTSAFVEVRQGMQGWAGLARIDSLDPDTAIGDNSRMRVIAGGAYWLHVSSGTVGFVVTNEQVHYDGAQPTDNRLLLQMHLEY